MMDLQKIRSFFLIALVVVGLLLFFEWQKTQVPAPLPAASTEQQRADGLPIDANITAEKVNQTLPSSPTPVSTPEQSLIHVTTDTLNLKIDPLGGDIVQAELLKYPQNIDNPHQGKILLDKSSSRNYIVQSGLIGKNQHGPDSHQLGRARYQSVQQHYQMQNNKLKVDLVWQSDDAVKVTKSYIFTPNSYVVDVNYQIENPTLAPWNGTFYGQIRRQFNEVSKGFFGLPLYEGGAIYTPEKPFKKLSTKDMKKAPFTQNIQGGWAAFVEHYFLSAWIPSSHDTHHYYTRLDNDDFYNIGSTSNVSVPAQSKQNVQAQLYIGPEVADLLKPLAKGLDLTIDYGMLWPISQTLFWLLKNIYQVIGNWGWSIIFVTLCIKLVFYKLSASSYRSMGKMRNLQPKLEALKLQHANDKQRFSIAMMELYKSEKVNPLGGCLPILIQIPVFIALYYVLLESVELRQAPFILWIRDLSVADPYYVLPIIMGLTMFAQQKLNPAPPDPMQAKVMLVMPVIFTALFASFPAGLVLYWTANNILSMLQQWYITHNISKERLPLKVKAANS